MYERFSGHDLRKICDDLNAEFFRKTIEILEIRVLEDSEYHRRLNATESSEPSVAFYTAGGQTISLKKSYYDQASFESLEDTMYHEMCHQLVSGHDLTFELLTDNYQHKRRCETARESGIDAGRRQTVLKLVDVLSPQFHVLTDIGFGLLWVFSFALLVSLIGLIFDFGTGWLVATLSCGLLWGLNWIAWTQAQKLQDSLWKFTDEHLPATRYPRR